MKCSQTHFLAQACSQWEGGRRNWMCKCVVREIEMVGVWTFYWTIFGVEYWVQCLQSTQCANLFIINGPATCHTVWCMYSNLILIIVDSRVHVHKYEYSHCYACIRKRVSLDANVLVFCSTCASLKVLLHILYMHHWHGVTLDNNKHRGFWNRIPGRYKLMGFLHKLFVAWLDATQFWYQDIIFH